MPPAVKLAWNIVKSPFAKSRNGVSLYKYAAYQGLLYYQCGLDATSVQNLLPPSVKTCADVARKYRIRHQVVHLEGGVTASRFGGESASKALLYFHGGGYMGTALPAQAHAAIGFGKSLPEGVAVFFLHYSE